MGKKKVFQRRYNTKSFMSVFHLSVQLSNRQLPNLLSLFLPRNHARNVFVKHRWKGENVATTEVADHLLMVDCIEEANVYGVKVSGNNNYQLFQFLREFCPKEHIKLM